MAIEPLRDLGIVTLLMVPNLVLAVTSTSGNHAGYYVLAGMLATSIVVAVWPIGFFIYAATVLAAAAALFRDQGHFLHNAHAHCADSGRGAPRQNT